MKEFGGLGSDGWLGQQPDGFIDWIALAGRWVIVGPSRPLYSAGDPPDALYGLAFGMLDIALPITGDEEVTIHRAEPGLWIGESAILAGTQRSVSITTVTECRLWRVPQDEILRRLESNPADWQCFFTLSHLNVTAALRMMAEILSLSPPTRFARMLLRLADARGVVRVTQEEMGRLSGMSRSTFRRALADLEAAGAVRTAYGCLHITNRTILGAEAFKG